MMQSERSGQPEVKLKNKNCLRSIVTPTLDLDYMTFTFNLQQAVVIIQTQAKYKGQSTVAVGSKASIYWFMIVHIDNADLEVLDTCVRTP